MNMTRYNNRYYNPWSVFDQFQRELSAGNDKKLDDASAADWAPAVDVREDDKSYTLLIDVPGIDPKNIDVSTEKGMLSVKGEREKVETKEGENFRRVERNYGSFARYFDLPENADSENIQANAEHGVLTISIPKQDVAVSKRIEVQH